MLQFVLNVVGVALVAGGLVVLDVHPVAAIVLPLGALLIRQ